jgi:Asp-tRNA(Asn)/Glu-tRNA(Gln) amidotransferase B subunit
MSTTHDRRGRRRQAARNLTIAVATAALAGTGAAMAADGGAASGKTGTKTGDRPPLAENEPIVTQARAGLARLVADGTIEQSEADAVLREVIAGSVDPGALVRAGDVSAAHMPAINDVLREVKRANAGAKAGDEVKQADAGSAKTAPKPGDRPPLAETEPVVTQARAGLARLVADGTIEQSEADAVMREVIAGSAEPEALVRAGDVSAAHMAAITDVLSEVKRANAGPKTGDAIKQAKLG